MVGGRADSSARPPLGLRTSVEMRYTDNVGRGKGPRREEAPQMFETRYKIVRFYQDGRKRTIKKGLSKAEAQAHCRREDTHGVGWFDGWTEQ